MKRLPVWAYLVLALLCVIVGYGVIVLGLAWLDRATIVQ